MDLGNADNSLDERDLPNFYCEECSAVRFAGEPSCSSCRAVRPEAGWTPLAECDDAYLGCVVDGRYLITKREASGGSAVVYRARSIHEDHVVAIKIARLAETDSMEESSVRERMSREVRAVQMLENPHIVPIYEFLELDGGPAAIVMQYVSGQSAEEIVREEGPLKLERALRIARQVASGLAEAHRSDLIHRDIKPANVMLETGDDEKAYILDFGIVRLQAASRSTNGFLGTPSYASPEQIRMRTLDARTDIYSLGATLYYLLAGQPPFEDDEMMEVMRAHLESPVPRIGSRRGESLPRQLEELVSLMLAKEREDRPADLEQVVERIEALESATGGGDVRLGAGETDAGLHEPVDSDTNTERSSRTESAERYSLSDGRSSDDIRPALDHVSGFGDAASSAEFTPAASETSEFGPLASETDEIQVDEGRSPGETQTGVQPAREPGESRELAAEHSIEFWPETENTEGASPSGDDLEMLATRKGDAFLVGDREGGVWLMEGDGGSTLSRVASGDDDITAAALGTKYAWLGWGDGRIERVDLEDRTRVTVASAEGEARITGLAAARDDSKVVAGTEAGEVMFRRRDSDAGWERRTGEGPVDAVCVTADGRQIVAARRGGMLELMRLEEQNTERVALEENRRVDQLAVASSGEVLGVFYPDGTAQVVHAPTGRVVVDIPRAEAALQVGYFDSSGDLMGVEADASGWLVRNLAEERVVAEVGATSPVRPR